MIDTKIINPRLAHWTIFDWTLTAFFIKFKALRLSKPDNAVTWDKRIILQGDPRDAEALGMPRG